MPTPPTRPLIVRLEQRLAGLRKAVPGRERLLGGLEHALMAALAALAAYAPAALLRLPESYWAAITAISVVQTSFGATRSTARDQFTGAAVGGAVGVSAALAVGSGVAVYLVAVMVAIVACWLCNVSSAGRLAGSTVTIILLVPHADSTASRITLARVGEVGWGVAVALAVVGAGTWVAARLFGAPPETPGRAAR